MKAGPKTEQAKQSSHQSLASSLALAFDQCPSVLFAFLSDNEAARVARALCVPQFLSTKRYDIKRELPAHAAVAGLFPGVVRRVTFDRNHEASSLSLLPSTVTSMKMEHVSKLRGRFGDLPRSLTHLAYWVDGDDDLAAKHEGWPPSLTSLELQYGGSKPFSAPLPSTLRVLLCNADLSPSLVLPDSLTTLSAGRLDRPVSQLPPHLTELSIRLPEVKKSKKLVEQAQPMDLSNLPASLTHLKISGRLSPYGPPVVAAKFPPLLRCLRLVFVTLRLTDTLPESLEELTITRGMAIIDHPFRHARLRKLVLPDEFNQLIRASDFPSLQVLSLGSKFNHPLDDLPRSLSELTVRGDLDRLPASLTMLTPKRAIKRPLDKLPSSLRILDLRSEIRHNLNHLPDSLAELRLAGSNFNKPLDHLPRQLKMLALSDDFQQSLDALPDGLTHLDLSRSRTFNHPLDHLPDSLQALFLPEAFNHPFPRLPSGLRVLDFPPFAHFNRPLDHLPESLKSLRLGGAFNQPFHRLPRGLAYLSLGRAFNHPLPLSSESIPESKTYFHRDITYPTALRSLTLGDRFNHPLSLPPSLTRLTLTSNSSVPLSVSSLPEQLMALIFPFEKYPQLTDREALRKRCPLLRLQNECW